MSRIGKLPITVPSGVTVTIADDNTVTVKGPKGTLSEKINPEMKVALEDGVLTVSRPSESKPHKAMHGLYRSLINNMVVGVTNGFSKTLLMEGVGYRAVLNGNSLTLNLGFSHPVVVDAPAEISFEVPAATQIVISGISKQKVGAVAADIRKLRKPEPYLGKGIRYSDERIRRKEGKTGK